LIDCMICEKLASDDRRKQSRVKFTAFQRRINATENEISRINRKCSLDSRRRKLKRTIRGRGNRIRSIQQNRASNRFKCTLNSVPGSRRNCVKLIWIAEF
jgi:hypothetical protein